MSSINLVILQGSLTRPDLKREMRYLEKLLYKNQKQHRASQHFRRLQEVQKFLRLWDSLSIPELIGTLNDCCLPSAKPAFGQGNPKEPNQGNVILLLQRIISGCSLLEALFPALRKAAAALSAQLALTFFLPLCMTGLAIMARVQVLAAQWVHDAVAAYNSLIEHVTTMPQQTGTPGRTPTVIRISFPEGDSFSRRVQESARLAQLQIRRPGSKAALLELFGNDFDIGEKVERLSVSCTGSAAPAALEPERIHLLAEAAQQTSPAKGPDFAVFEDREPGSMHVEAAQPAYESAAYIHSLARGLINPAGAAFHVQSGAQHLPHQAMPPMRTAAVMSASLQLQPEAESPRARNVASDQESLWSAEEQESQGDGAFGAVDHVSGPVIMGPAATPAGKQQELNTMRLSSSPEHLQSAAPDTSQQPAGGSLPVGVAEDIVADSAATSITFQKQSGAAAVGAWPQPCSADMPAGASSPTAAAIECPHLQYPLLGSVLAAVPPAAATTPAALQISGLAPSTLPDVSPAALAAGAAMCQAPVSEVVQAAVLHMPSALAAGDAAMAPEILAKAVSAVRQPLRDRRGTGTPAYIGVDAPHVEHAAPQGALQHRTVVEPACVSTDALHVEHAAAQHDLSGTSMREPSAPGALLSTSRTGPAHAAPLASTAGPASANGPSGGLDKALQALPGQGTKRTPGALLTPSKAQLKRARKAAAKQRSAQDAQQTAGHKRDWQEWLLHKPGGD